MPDFRNRIGGKPPLLFARGVGVPPVSAVLRIFFNQRQHYQTQPPPNSAAKGRRPPGQK